MVPCENKQNILVNKKKYLVNYMKAIVCLKYGPPEVLVLKEVAKPNPKDNEVLIRIFATAVNSADWRLRKPEPLAVRLFFGLTKPKKPILGGVFSGEIEAIGKNVTLFKTGDQVFGSTGMHFGAYAEYTCLPEDGVFTIKPYNTSHKESASIPFGGINALDFLKKAAIQPGQKVLIYGASGAIGTAAVQLARYFGAEVTAVCSTSNLEIMKAIGASKVIDYTKEDFTKNGETYDVIFETVNKLSFSKSIKSLKKQGVLILGAAGVSQMLQGLLHSLMGRMKVITGLMSESAEDIIFLRGLIEQGHFKAVVDRSYPLEKMVEAHTYVEQGHKKGNVAITLVAAN